MMEDEKLQNDIQNQEETEEAKTLTQRLVKLSERKMKLIRHLLSPEEYSSIAVNLFSQESTDVTDQATLSSWGAGSTKVIDDYETEYSSSIMPEETIDRSIATSLTKKQEANEFFFHSNDNDEQKKQGDSSIELRSGYYINYEFENDKPVLLEDNFDFSVNTLKFLGSKAKPKIRPKSLVSRQVTCPFSTSRNLKVMQRRAKLDNTLDKLIKSQDIEIKTYKHNFVGYNQHQLMNFYGSMQSKESTWLEWEDSRIMHNFCGFAGRRQEDDAGSIQIKIISIMLRDHPKLTYEEKLAGKLADCGRELELLREIGFKITNKLITKVQSFQLKYSSSEIGPQSKLLIVIDQLTQIFRKMKTMQKELLEVYEEMISVRKEQKFSSTTIYVDQDIQDQEVFANLGSILTKLTESLDVEEGLKESLNNCVILIRETNQQLIIRFSTRNEKLSSVEEQTRRIELVDWIESLLVSMSVDDKNNFDWSLEINNDNLFILNPEPSTIQLRGVSSKNKELKIRASTNKKRFLTLTNRTQPLSEIYVTIELDCSTRHSINLESSDGIMNIQLVFETKPMETVDEDVRKKLVNLLHADLFPSYSSLMDHSSKVYELMNYVDPDFLSKIFGVDYEDYFHVYSQGEFVEGTGSSRYSLLFWRWINRLKQVVYLSNQENLKIHGKQAQEFKAKLKYISNGKLYNGYNSIEITRAQALVYIRKLEDRLLRAGRARMEQMKLSQDVEIPHVDRFLQHPRISIDLSGFARLATSLMPRPTARRPLGAQKEVNRWRSLKTNLLHSSEGNQNGHLGHPQLVVNLQSASNVPMRITHRVQPMQSRSLTPIPTTPGLIATPISMNSGEFSPLPTIDFEPTISYAELIFQRYQVASSLAHGRHPAWNETLFLPIQVSKTSPTTAESLLVDEHLQISLWDYFCKQEDTVGEENRLQLQDNTLSPLRTPQKVNASSQRVERHLLGYLKIPLSALISTGKIEGTFALEQDSILENYSFGSEWMMNNAAGLEQEEKFKTNSAIVEHSKQLQTTYIRLFITLEPPIAFDIQRNLDFNFSTYETDHLLRYAQLWERTFSERPSKTRVKSVSKPSASQSRNVKHSINRLHVKTLVLQSDIKYVIICRMLQKLDPPGTLIDDITETPAKMLVLARFVSLLCPLKYGIFQSSTRALASTLWFDSWQLLVKCLGGPEEKAVLLCNYFLALGLYSGLLLGDSIQEGRCIYVIVWEDLGKPTLESELQLQAAELFKSISGITTTNSALSIDTSINSNSSIQIWNPTNAIYYTNLSISPLLSVGAIVTVDNVYANLQDTHTSRFANFTFNIRSKQHWFPLFDNITSSNSPQPSSNFNFGLSKKLGGGKPVSWAKKLQTLEYMRQMLGPVIVEPIVKLGQMNYDSRLSEEECQHVREKIELEVKAHLLKWRPQRPTYFNRSLSQSVQEWLKQFEEVYSSGKESHPAWHIEIARLIKNEPMSGFRVPLANPSTGRKLISCPVNISYTGMEVILDTVYASGVHNVDLVLGVGRNFPQTQFMMGCHVKSFPSRVVSIWLYVAAILSI